MESSAFSDLQTRKLNRLFDFHDTNRDGVLEQDDMLRIADRLADVKSLPKTSTEAESFRVAFAAEWQELEAAADTNQDKLVSRNEWLAYMGKVLNAPGEYDRRIVPVADMIIALVDDDDDGRVTAENWDVFFRVYGIDTPAAEIFPKIDRDGDGKVDREEILKALREYFYSSDPEAPGNWFYGRW